MSERKHQDEARAKDISFPFQPNGFPLAEEKLLGEAGAGCNPVKWRFGFVDTKAGASRPKPANPCGLQRIK